MLYGIGADLVVLVHLAFIVFVMAGAWLILWWRWVLWLHVPAAAWGAFVQFTGRICPLTPLENYLRELGGQDGYSESFVQHYVIPVIYPTGLTQEIQLLLGVLVLLVNGAAYTLILRKTRSRI